MWNFHGLSPALNIGNRITSFEIKIGNKIVKQQKNLKIYLLVCTAEFLGLG